MQAVFDRSYRRLVGQVIGLTRSRAEAEDVVQEAFVQAVARREFATMDKPEAWLLTVALNQARRRWRRGRHFLGLLPKLTEHPQRHDSAVDRVALLTALRALPAPQREAIALHHLADLPVAEVAELLGVPEGTVKARLSRGRAALLPLLEETYEDSPQEARHA
ncbi:sigma-70 family RNA polymerase sigma factor [Knoellia sp. DB2414S]|uniref:Sigma-70 family RNA polymerase sigma factor n=1 Tax=Knoellia koreensis TaxID=2730921 RepID=A0A849HEC6_9MICO|nr:sigma-70 family RNA polymerase sigma factor [Knoellia sp. DB2414S]